MHVARNVHHQIRLLTTCAPALDNPGRRPIGGGYRGQLKGHGPDSTRIRISKNLSRILRHDAVAEGLQMRQDGYVRVVDLLRHPTMHTVNFSTLEKVVRQDAKQRFHLYRDTETDSDSSLNGWWIAANQGHSIPNVELDMRRIDKDAIPPLAIHGTTEKAWKRISKEGLSKMGRHHIHIAQGLADHGVISGMRNNSRVIIHINMEKAMKEDIKFYESRNGVILTPGNSAGYLEPRFFRKVEKLSEHTTFIIGWEGKAIPPGHPLLRESRPEEYKVKDKDDEEEQNQPKEDPFEQNLKWRKPHRNQLRIF